MATPVYGKFISRTTDKTDMRKNTFTVVKSISNAVVQTTGSDSNTAFYADGDGYVLNALGGGQITGNLVSGSGSTYIFWAFAEQPGFTNSNTFPNAR